MQAHDKPRDRVGWDQRGGYGLLWQHLCNPTITTKEKTKQEKICERQNEKKTRTEKVTMGCDLCKKAMQAHVLRQGD